MRVGSDAAPAAGRGRFSRTRAAPGAPPDGHYEPSARSMALGGRPPAHALRPKREARAGATGGPCKARPGAVRKTPRWRAMRRPRLSRGSAARTNNGCATWRAISLALREGEIVENGDRPAQGLDKQHAR